MGSTCMDCGSKKKDITISHSFLCEPCQDNQFERIRGNLQGEETDVKNNIEKVQELTAKGLKPKEIAKKLKIGLSTVYSYRSINKTNVDQKEEPKINGAATDNKLVKEFDELNMKYEKLKLNVNSLEKDNADLEQENMELKECNDSISIELNELEDKYKEMSEKVSGSVSTNNDEIAALQTIISELTKEKEFLLKETSDLRLKNADLIDEAREDLHAIHSKYKTEKAKHETLFKYVNLSSEVS